MIRDILIHAVMNGFTCQVGCQTIVFNTIEDLLTSLNEYYKDPTKTEREWVTTAINAKHTMGVPAPAGADSPPLGDIPSRFRADYEASWIPNRPITGS